MAGRTYADRAAAGRVLAQRLGAYEGRPDVVVLGLPRGGVVVAATVADALRLPLDVLVVRKLGVPWHPELAMGAIAAVGGDVVEVLNREIVTRSGASEAELARVRTAERAVLEERSRALRAGRAPQEITGRTVLLVDDGLATGASMRAAVSAVREQEPAGVVVAVPVGSPDTVEALAAEVDEVVCPSTPLPFMAVGYAYDSFEQTTDDEVRALLTQ